VTNGLLREVKSTIILQPGPAALTEGLDAISAIVNEWVERQTGSVLASPQLRKQG
jgi:iron complex transport system substrate-binding protein